jgi:hypothetical protein
MAEAHSQPQIIDPDNVSETICNGLFNINVVGGLAYLTFTHLRPDATKLFAGASQDSEYVVRARVVIPVASLLALKEVLNRVIVDGKSQPLSATVGTRH